MCSYINHEKTENMEQLFYTLDVCMIKKTLCVRRPNNINTLQV